MKSVFLKMVDDRLSGLLKEFKERMKAVRPRSQREEPDPFLVGLFFLRCAMVLVDVLLEIVPWFGIESSRV